MTAEKGRSRLVEFFRAEYDRLVGYVRRLIDDTAERDGEDIVQEVITHMFDVADVTIPIENLSAYIYRSLRNRVVDYLRKRKTPALSLEEELFNGSDFSLSDLIYDLSDNALDELEEKEMLHQVFSAIDSLGEDQKAVFIETEFEGRSFRELSQEWNVPLGTLLARKSRALEKIRRLLVDSNI